VVAVTQGDCSQTHAMMETLQLAGVRIIPFAFPYDRDRELLETQLRRFRSHFGVSSEQVEEVRQALRPLRTKVAEIDRLTWEEGRVTGEENHLYQITCSDFGGDPKAFEAEVDAFLVEARRRPAAPGGLRLGLMGVPPILTNLYEYLAGLGVQVVFNEVQRQFTMADSLDEDLVTQYQRYTYPYDIFARLEDVKTQTTRRSLQGLLHYTQAFCFRQIEDLIVKRSLEVPLLTLEGEDPAEVDARTQLRIEAFVETLRARTAHN
jgi:benzoyl-CoA reductase/2-hydroxyglutaryl-CoA dehydratase subunit BcrC/BadD/HgdB